MAAKELAGDKFDMVITDGGTVLFVRKGCEADDEIRLIMNRNYKRELAQNVKGVQLPARMITSADKKSAPDEKTVKTPAKAV